MQPQRMEGTKRDKTRFKHSKRKLHRSTGIKWDYNGDGQYKTESIHKPERKKWNKWLKKKELKQLGKDEGVKIR